LPAPSRWRGVFQIFLASGGGLEQIACFKRQGPQRDIPIPDRDRIESRRLFDVLDSHITPDGIDQGNIELELGTELFAAGLVQLCDDIVVNFRQVQIDVV
jgi:hypothetical protein